MVDIESESYRVAREYMIRLEPADFSNRDRVEKLASAAGLATEEFLDRFGYLSGTVPS
jgi:6-phosphofructokinase 1